MTSQPKPRRKKVPEPLDWRELAEGPALRGLAEVLATPPEVARDRASKRAAMDAGAVDIANESGTVGESPTVTVPPSVGGTVVEPSPPTPTRDPHVGVLPSEGVMPSEGLILAASVEATEGVSPSAGVTPPSSEGLVAVETVIAPNLLVPTVGETPTDGVTPAGGDAITVGASPVMTLRDPSPDFPPFQPDQTAQPRRFTTVGVSPTVDIWVGATGAHYERKRVQPVGEAQHSMSLGEERVYRALWQASESQGVVTENPEAKLFTLGYDRIAHLVRLNEKSVRLLLPKLLAKKVLEIVAAEHSASRTGRTYRIYSPAAILERQRAANLTNVVKNGRAVEFVWPLNATEGGTPTVGPMTVASP